PSCPAEPPPGLYQPISGFGRLWCENPEIREEIGFATAAEVEAFENSLQEFERGYILRDSNDYIYLLF
ncbi:MAG: hypothetical protein GWN58_54105, partial [Anaerolineae bacterium]|nr:hypothetical protein [Anaerolineae bacterium]